MDTIVIKLNQSDKAKLLIEMLRSMDFISTVEFFDKQIKTKKLFDEINKLASKSELTEMSLDDINKEIMDYRNGQ